MQRLRGKGNLQRTLGAERATAPGAAATFCRRSRARRRRRRRRRRQSRRPIRRPIHRPIRRRRCRCAPPSPPPPPPSPPPPPPSSPPPMRCHRACMVRACEFYRYQLTCRRCRTWDATAAAAASTGPRRGRRRRRCLRARRRRRRRSRWTSSSSRTIPALTGRLASSSSLSASSLAAASATRAAAAGRLRSWAAAEAPRPADVWPVVGTRACEESRASWNGETIDVASDVDDAARLAPSLYDGFKFQSSSSLSISSPSSTGRPRWSTVSYGRASHARPPPRRRPAPRRPPGGGGALARVARADEAADGDGDEEERERVGARPEVVSR